MTTPADLLRAMLEAARTGDVPMILLSLALIAVLAFWIVGITYGVIAGVREDRARRRREIQAAMYRHPASISERERRYHGDDSIGR